MITAYEPLKAAASAAKFPSTCWTVILSLKSDDVGSAWQKALRTLCQDYWFPLYAFARHKGMQRADAEDAVQNFFSSIGDVDFFRKADQEKGKLRTFILTAFTRQMHTQTVRNQAQKRGGGVQHVSLDADLAESWLLADPKTQDQDATLAFERHWAKNLMRAALDTLRAEECGTERGTLRFETLCRFLNPDTCEDFTLAQAAKDLEISQTACEKAVQRLRQRFRMAVRELVASTLHSPDEADVLAEMAELQKALLAQ